MTSGNHPDHSIGGDARETSLWSPRDEAQYQNLLRRRQTAKQEQYARIERFVDANIHSREMTCEELTVSLIDHRARLIPLLMDYQEIT